MGRVAGAAPADQPADESDPGGYYWRRSLHATIVKQGDIYRALTGAVPGGSTYMLTLILAESATGLAVAFSLRTANAKSAQRRIIGDRREDGFQPRDTPSRRRFRQGTVLTVPKDARGRALPFAQLHRAKYSIFARKKFTI